MNPGNERRDFERNKSESGLIYTSWNSYNWKKAKMCDFSTGGIRFESGICLQPGEDLFVKIGDRLSDFIVNCNPGNPLRAEVVWCKESMKTDSSLYEIGAAYTERFWEKSYDPDVTHIDPEIWEMSYTDITRSTFDALYDKPVFYYMGVNITFAELDQYANRFANMLMLNSFKKGDVVGISLPNIPEYIIAWLGTLKAGCIVSGMSPFISKPEMEYQLKDCNAKGLVTLDAMFAEKVIHIEKNLPNLKLMVTTNMGDSLSGIKRTLGKLTGKIPKGKVVPIKEKIVLNFKKVIKGFTYSAIYPDVHITPDDIAYIHYTDWTSGSPKGAMRTHRNIVSEMLILDTWLQLKKRKEPGTVLSNYPLFHSTGINFSHYFIYKGLTQVLIPDAEDTNHICAEMEKYKPSALASMPSSYQLLMSNLKFRGLDHSNLEICFTSNMAFPKNFLKAFETVVGEDKLLGIYGLTETGSLATANPVQGKKMPGSIGLPLINTDIKLVEPGTNCKVPTGTPGEILIKGPQVMKGYYETSQMIDAEGFIRTGEMAVYDNEGYLYIANRKIS